MRPIGPDLREINAAQVPSRHRPLARGAAAMPMESVLVVIGVVLIFATFGATLFFGARYSRGAH